VSTPKPIAEHLLEYRKVLVAADQKGQEEFDKAVLSLSGGALGVSLVFLKDVIGSDPIQYPYLMMLAWACWAFSTLAVLSSYHMSNLTVREGIAQIDRDEAYSGPIGGRYAAWTQRLNMVGAGLFFAGVLLITVFASINLSNKERSNGHQAPTASPAAAPALGADSAVATSRPGSGSREGLVAAGAAPASEKAVAASGNK